MHSMSLTLYHTHNIKRFESSYSSHLLTQLNLFLSWRQRRQEKIIKIEVKAEKEVKREVLNFARFVVRKTFADAPHVREIFSLVGILENRIEEFVVHINEYVDERFYERLPIFYFLGAQSTEIDSEDRSKHRTLEKMILSHNFWSMFWVSFKNGQTLESGWMELNRMWCFWKICLSISLFHFCLI